MSALDRYLEAREALKLADKRALAALCALIRPGDRVEWRKGRGEGVQSGQVISFEPWTHDGATVRVRSRTGKEYGLAAFWITDELARAAAAKPARRRRKGTAA